MALSKYLACSLITILLWQMSSHVRGVSGRRGNGSFRDKSAHLKATTVDIKEKIIEWQCYAKCSQSKGFQNFETCKTQCKAETMRSPRAGQCPRVYLANTAESEKLQNLVCLNECSADFDCPEVQKCCTGSPCGPVCTNALGLVEDVRLPPIPKILHLKLPKGHKVEITIQTSANSTIYYHIETRNHIGHLFSPRKLGSWQWQPVEMTAEEILENKKKRIQICFNLKPGRWYQVRIAAINAHGYRGYSEPSNAFKLSKNPRPPMAPVDLQVVDATFNGRYYNANIVWCPSKSNLPVEKYKVIWSLYVRTKEESIISNEAFVRDMNYFQITKLLPESSYYIQVLAICISGSRRLKSEKISILFNTTSTTVVQNKPLKCFQTMSLEQSYADESQTPPKSATTSHLNTTTTTTVAYEVRYRLNRKFGMIIQISGFQPNKEKVYELCPNDNDCEHREYSAIRAKKNSLEFSKLKYNTTYFLKTIKPSFDETEGTNLNYETLFSFKTPKCENFRKRFPKMLIQC